MSEPVGRRRAATPEGGRGGGLWRAARGSKAPKGGKRAARPGPPVTPAYIELELPESTPELPLTSTAPAVVNVDQPAAAPEPARLEPEPVLAPEPELEPEAEPELAAESESAPEPDLEPEPEPEPAPAGSTLSRAEELTLAVMDSPTGEMPAVLWAPRRPAARAPLQDRRDPVLAPRVELTLWGAFLVVGAALLFLGGVVEMGPRWVTGLGSLVVTLAYVWVLVRRTGGRPLILCSVTLVAGLVTLVVDQPQLNTGAAAIVATVAAVLGVVITVPAVRPIAALRETFLALVVAAGGAVAAVGWSPEVDLATFEYVVLVLAFVCAFTLVYRLGAGLHGLGRRGALMVTLGAAVLVLTLLYAEALRHWTNFAPVDAGLDFVAWCRDHLGAFPRPLLTVLGVPTLIWGTHMRARRRQGWWVCAFGTAATAAVAVSLMNPGIGLIEVALSIGYGTVIGSVLGYVIIRIDLALTGSRGERGSRGTQSRRGRRAEEREKAVRPEPKRIGALL